MTMRTRMTRVESVVGTAGDDIAAAVAALEAAVAALEAAVADLTTRVEALEAAAGG